MSDSGSSSPPISPGTTRLLWRSNTFIVASHERQPGDAGRTGPTYSRGSLALVANHNRLLATTPIGRPRHLPEGLARYGTDPGAGADRQNPASYNILDGATDAAGCPSLATHRRFVEDPDARIAGVLQGGSPRAYRHVAEPPPIPLPLRFDDWALTTSRSLALLDAMIFVMDIKPQKLGPEELKSTYEGLSMPERVRLSYWLRNYDYATEIIVGEEDVSFLYRGLDEGRETMNVFRWSYAGVSLPSERF